MESGWMGRYRNIVSALVLHGNVVLRTQSALFDIGDGIIVTSQQWQILEYIVLHNDNLFNMLDISYRLNIPQSTFSKTVKLLYNNNLVEKFQTANNRKNVILRPTEKGLQLYRNHSAAIKDIFQSFFDALEEVSDKDLNAVAKAIEALDNEMIPERKEEIELIRLNRKE